MKKEKRGKRKGKEKGEEKRKKAERRRPSFNFVCYPLHPSLCSRFSPSLIPSVLFTVTRDLYRDAWLIGDRYFVLLFIRIKLIFFSFLGRGGDRLIVSRCREKKMRIRKIFFFGRFDLDIHFSVFLFLFFFFSFLNIQFFFL